MRLLFLLLCIMIGSIYSQGKDTVTKSDYTMPTWAKKVVWYQIFPERFRNGDTKNNPKVEDIKGSWPHDHTSPWKLHPWGSDWYELQDYEKKNGKDVWFNIQRRRYGGDLQGILDKLDYLQELGVTALYLNPVFTAPSMHKYDGATYHHVDPTFGPTPEEDKEMIKKEVPDDPSTWVWTNADKLVLKLIKEVHKRNMKIIFDGVFNHMGINSWAFQDVLKNQQKSKYKDWFSIKSWADPKKNQKFDYEGWFGVRELPELKEDENGIVEGPKKYIFAITKRWMDPNGDGNCEDGIDGWRLDVAFCVKHPFWKDWRKVVKGINPEAYITAEVIDKISVVKEYLHGDEFDSVMNYNFAFTSAEFFADKKNISPTEFDKKLKELRDAFHLEMAYGMQNLFNSHDCNRVASHIVNGMSGYRNWGDYFGKSMGKNKKYNTRKPNKSEKAIQKLFVIFQMTYLGAPMVYYGDEAGMWGANDPCCRKPMVWDDITYDDEIYEGDGTKREKPDSVSFDHDMFEHYKKLIKIRNEHVALQLGDYKTVLTDDKKEVYAFSRTYKGKTVSIILNNSEDSQDVLFPIATGKYKELLTGKEYGSEGSIKINIPSKWGGIFVKK